MASEPLPAERPAPNPPPFSPKPKCVAGILMANSLESGFFEDRLACVTTVRGDGFTVRQGAIHKRRLALMISGSKPGQAFRAAEALVFGHSPRFVIAAGFASGLTERLERGDLVV